MSAFDLEAVKVREPNKTPPGFSLDTLVIPRGEETTPEFDLKGTSVVTNDEIFRRRRRDILSDVSHQFGGDAQFGRTTKQMLRGIFDDTTDVNRIHQDLQDLNTNEPELASSKEGLAYQAEMTSRVKAVLDADEIKTIDTIKLLVDKTVNDFSGMVDLVGEGMYEDPSLPLLFAAAYYTGGRAAHATSKSSGLASMIARMKISANTKTRAMGIATEGAVDIFGVMGAEAGMGFAYEVAQNKAIGNDPLHNATQVAAMSALLGGGIKGLGTAFKLIHGFPGKYKTFNEAIQDMVDGGFNVPEIIKLLRENMDELPQAMIDKAESAWRVKQAKDTKAPINPFVEKDSSIIKDPDSLFASLRKAYVDKDLPGQTTVSNIYESKSEVIQSPVGSTGKRGVYYNLKKIVEDFENNFGFLKGETKKGTLGTGRAAQTRKEAFKDFDFKEFKKWITQNGGAKGYAEFLTRLEAYKLRFGDTVKNPGVNVYRRATYEALVDMNADPRRFVKDWRYKTKLKLEAGYNYAKHTAQEVAADPSKLWLPVKDVILGTKQFADDLLYGPVEGKLEAMRQRGNLANLLRDWEGGRMAGELPINDFANYIKGHLKTQEKLVAMSHYLENNLDAFNAKRVRDGLPEVKLTDKDLEVAASIRKFFDDTLDWAQKAHLFTQFRRNQNLYSRARNYSAGTQGVDYIKGRKGKALQDEAWEYIKTLDDPRGLARRLTPEKRRDTPTSYELSRRANYVPHITKKQFAPTENELYDAAIADMHRASQLQTTSRFTKERSYDTLTDTVAAGNTLLTEDISSLIRTYGKSMLRAQINNRLVGQLMKMNSHGTGKPLIGSKSEVPDWYVEFKHPNFRDRDGNYLYVNPNLAPDLRLYFDTNDPMIANRMLQNVILISKRSALGLSLFHMMALGWSGLASGQAPGQVMKNVLPLGHRFRSVGLRALAGEEGHNELLRGMRNGLGIGVLEELKGDTLINAMRRLGAGTEKLLAGNQYLKPIGKMGNMGWKGLARTQEIIDTHLWDHVNTGLKATTYLTTFEKMVRRDVRKAGGDPSKLTSKDVLAQRAAQFTNDAYGNQNWNQMAMNVQNHMGHRFAAALNKPSMRGYVRMMVFAPDWTLSNMRVIGKSLDITDKAHPEYMAYTLRSAILFAFVAEALQQASGQGSIFDDSLKDALRPDLGDGKQMEISKQLAEVVRLFIHGPVHVGKHKMGTLPKSLAHTDSVGDYLWDGWVVPSVPIGVKQIVQNPELGPYGVAGIPVYGKY